MRMRSKNSTEATTMPPAMAPMMTALQLPTAAQPAVMPTSPARRPLPAMATSGLPSLNQVIRVATRAPATPESSVVTAMAGTAASAASSEPGLNPNQPMRRMKQPMMAKGML